MDRLLAMQTFVRVVETGSFSAVAREMNSTQGAVSKQVAALEKHLGARLLTRTTRSLALTDDGRRYFEDARRLAAEIEESEAAVRSGAQTLSGWLRVAASVGFGRLVLLPHVKSFLALHPRVRIDLRLDDGFVDLIEQGIDLTVRIGHLADSGLVARRVGWSYGALMASRRYVEALAAGPGLPASPADLAAHNCIVYTERESSNTWHFGAGADAAVGGTADAAVGGTAGGAVSETVRVEGNLQTNSSEVIRASVLMDMGLCHGPTWLFADELASGAVRALLPRHSMGRTPIHLLSPPHRQHAAKVRAFSEHVARMMAACDYLSAPSRPAA